MTVAEMLAGARSRIARMNPTDIGAAVLRGAVVVDIRPQAQRDREGTLPGALAIERNVLEWRTDPASDARLAVAADRDVEWIIVCSQGYTSSLAAASLQELGLWRATDIVGGYEAIKAAGQLHAISSAAHLRREAATITAH